LNWGYRGFAPGPRDQSQGVKKRENDLFGSQACGDAEPGSDTDVLVVLKDPVCAGEEIDRTIDLVADLSLQHNEVISCAFIGEKRFKHRHGPLLRNIRREGIRI
jgi:predicted nucleotidyltransferase